MKISIIIPVYNEHQHILKVIDSVLNVTMPRHVTIEVIVVDDGSTDGTKKILEAFKDNRLAFLFSDENRGKGFAIRKGLTMVSGDIVIIQDADLEYTPNDLPLLIEPILNGKAKAVYGSRFLGKIEGMQLKYWLMNKLLILAVRIIYGKWITDEATGYKAFDKALIQRIPLKCQHFEFCPEITAKLLRMNVNIFEVPISYNARNIKQGKKVRFKDAIDAFATLLRYARWKNEN